MSLISPVQSHDHEDSPMGKEIRWEGFVEKIGFELGVKSEGVMDDESGEAMMTEMGWQVVIDSLLTELDCKRSGRLVDLHPED